MDKCRKSDTHPRNGARQPVRQTYVDDRNDEHDQGWGEPLVKDPKALGHCDNARDQAAADINRQSGVAAYHLQTREELTKTEQVDVVDDVLTFPWDALDRDVDCSPSRIPRRTRRAISGLNSSLPRAVIISWVKKNGSRISEPRMAISSIKPG